MAFQPFDRVRDAGLLVIRVGLGLAFMFIHGYGKLFGGLTRWEQIGANAAHVGLDFLPMFWGFMASMAEFGGGLLLLLGLFFRPALVLLIATMITAATTHIVTGNGSPWHAIELGIVFLGLFLVGPGQYSLDNQLSRRGRQGF